MFRRSRMSAIRFNNTNTPSGLNLQVHGPVVEEIPGLIRVYKDGHVERPPAQPEVSSTWAPEPDVTSRDVVINHSTGLWTRFYVPRRQQQQQQQLPLLVYFHGGGFCVGSAAWRCYHEFLAKLASRAGCIIMSVNYRLAPEHRLPAAYEDGLAAVKWVRQQANCSGGYSDRFSWWRNGCNFNQIYLCGDSAGATIAYNVATQLSSFTAPSYLKGMILIQPFFGGEARSGSEKNSVQTSKSALTLATSDCYWRLALPPGTNRDHPWSNPLGRRSPKLEELRLPPVLICVAEMDILKDRNLEFCKSMRRAGNSVESAIYAGVGHAFHVLHNYSSSQVRTQEMLADIKVFLQ